VHKQTNVRHICFTIRLVKCWLHYQWAQMKKNLIYRKNYSAVCSLQSAVCSLQTAVCGLQSTVCSLQSAVCSLQSAVCVFTQPICKRKPARWKHDLVVFGVKHGMIDAGFVVLEFLENFWNNLIVFLKNFWISLYLLRKVAWNKCVCNALQYSNSFRNNQIVRDWVRFNILEISVLSLPSKTPGIPPWSS